MACSCSRAHLGARQTGRRKGRFTWQNSRKHYYTVVVALSSRWPIWAGIEDIRPASVDAAYPSRETTNSIVLLIITSYVCPYQSVPWGGAESPGEGSEMHRERNWQSNHHRHHNIIYIMCIIYGCIYILVLALGHWHSALSFCSNVQQ